MTKKIVGLLLFLFLICLFGLYIFLSVKTKEQRLKQNMTVASGLIKDIDVVLKGDGIWLKYEFSFQNKIIENKKRILVDSKSIGFIKATLLNKYLPIIYDRVDYNNNELLITKEEYLRYNIQRPDTLMLTYHKLDSLKF